MTNVDAALALFKSINDDDLDAGAAQFADDAEWTEVPIGLTYRGPRGWHDNVNFWRDSFSEGAVEVTNVIDGGDQIAVEYIGSGTNTGPVRTPEGELPATGKRIVAEFVDIWEFRDGKIVKGRSYVAGLMAQLIAPQ
jgi:ketosteroid isomerase-like protein